MHRPERRKLLVLLFRTVYVPGFLMNLGLGMTAPIIPLFATKLGATLTLAGTIVALRGLGPILFNIPSGIFLTRVGNRKMLLTTTAGMVAVAVLTGVTRSLFFLGICTFLSGGLISSWQMTRVSFLRSAAPPEVRGRAISAFGGMLRIGGFIGPIVGGVIAQYLGFASTFYAQAAMIGAALIVYISPKSRRDSIPYDDGAESGSEGRSGKEAIGHPIREVVSVLKRHAKSLLTVGFVTIAFSVVRSARQIVFPLWGDAIELEIAMIGLIVGLSSGIDMLLFLPAGYIMDRKGRKWAAVPSLCIMSLALLLLPLSSGFAGLLAVGLAIGFGNGLGSGIVMTLGADLAPEENPGSFFGVWFLVANIGSTLGPLIIGGLADLISLGTASVVTSILGFCGAAYLLIFVPDTRKTRKHP